MPAEMSDRIFSFASSKNGVVAIGTSPRNTAFFLRRDLNFLLFERMFLPSKRIGSVHDTREKRGARSCNCKKSSCLKVSLKSELANRLTSLISSIVNVLPMDLIVTSQSAIVIVVIITPNIIMLARRQLSPLWIGILMLFVPKFTLPKKLVETPPRSTTKDVIAKDLTV